MIYAASGSGITRVKNQRSGLTFDFKNPTNTVVFKATGGNTFVNFAGLDPSLPRHIVFVGSSSGKNTIVQSQLGSKQPIVAINFQGAKPAVYSFKGYTPLGPLG